MKIFLQKVLTHIGYFREWYIWLPGIFLILATGAQVVVWLSGYHAKDDLGEIVGDLVALFPVVLVMIFTSWADGHLWCSLTREEYLLANTKAKLLDDLKPFACIAMLLLFAYLMLRH